MLYTKLIVYATMLAEHFSEVNQNKLVTEYKNFQNQLQQRSIVYE